MMDRLECDAPGNLLTKAKSSSSAERMRRKRARAAAAGAMTFVQHDWQLFLLPDRLPQKAGCRADQLRALALKELVDNALDQGAEVELQQLAPDAWAVADQGAGMDAATIARLFAVDRPLTTTKLLRRPTRGAVGNGLRVVTGAAIASGGKLWVEGRGQRFEIRVDRRSGATELVPAGIGVERGTRVEIRFGPALRAGVDDGHLARAALRFPGPAAAPDRSHLDWYDEASWRELAEAAPTGTSVAALLALMGIAVEEDRPATSVSLADLAAVPRPPTPRLLSCGARDGYAYAKVPCPDALIEVWAKAVERVPKSRARGTVKVLVNRTPVVLAGNISSGMYLWLASQPFASLDRVPAQARYEVEIAITAPVVPIVNDGKTPDLTRWCGPIGELVAKAMRAAFKDLVPPTGRRGDIKAAAWHVMEEAYLLASDDGQLPANARQIMYPARKLMAPLLGNQLVNDKYFTGTLLPDFIAADPDRCVDWDVVYDDRGHLEEPHTGVRVPLGTVAVRNYQAPRRQPESLLMLGRPADPPPQERYRTVLFVEKEGFLPLLHKARIGERFDVAIMSTKGTSVVASRHLLDWLAKFGIRVLILHDFDRAGLMIAHTLANDGRRYAFEQRPEVVDLGLRLSDVEEMDLESEPAPDNGPSAATLRRYGASLAEVAFLCRKTPSRVELNAMSSRQFITWLEAKLIQHGAGKVVPPPATLAAQAREAIARRLAQARIATIEREAWARAAAMAIPDDLEARVRAVLAARSELSWDDAIDRVVEAS